MSVYHLMLINMKKILIIDDDSLIRSKIRKSLEKKDYIVFTAKNGKEGIQLAFEVIPDLIISDIIMPKVDGYSVKKELDSNKNTNGIPFIFFTAKAGINDFRLGMDLGADDYLTKPYNEKNLISVIENRLERISQVSQKINNKFETNKREDNKFSKNGRLLISINNVPHLIKISEIASISAFGEYSNIYLTNGKKIIVRKLLKEWEQILPENIFVRIHRSTIINFELIERIEKWNRRSYIVYIQNNENPFTISERYASRLKTLVGTFG